MVAYTSPDCLPYFECDDSPCLNTGTVCEPSTVWCDLVAILEDRMNTFDATIARTSTSFPFFKVALTTRTTLAFSTVPVQITWDTVLADSDNLVNLDVNTQTAQLSRGGIWQFQLYMYGTPPGATGALLRSFINHGTLTASIADVSTMWRTGQFAYNSAQTTESVSQTTVDTLGYFVGAAVNSNNTGNIVIEYAELSGLWVADQ